jgi:uncharacterized protein YcbK (DUF882 family)
MGGLGKMTWKDIKHFSPSEFDCQCAYHSARPMNAATQMDMNFVRKLDALREAYGKPLTISSGWRCPEHNAAVSSTGDRGPHTTGRAVDLLVNGGDAYHVLRLAMQLGFTGLGISQKGPRGSRFLHLDDLDAPAGFPNRPTVWSY